MIQKFLIPFLILCCLGCGKNDLSTQSSITLKVNDCVTALENEVRICLDSVFNDSRCAKGLQCVWEGDATAAFTLNKNKVSKSFSLHTNNGFQNDTVIDGLSIRLLNITPYPIADGTIEASEYKAEISVSAY
ncbi:hypothetical protein [Gelidibacter salicanalis]|uniref:Uncharacterized protein n=1 Tax=Gelidibacter salicanalis TaxID=291193 RepID=A0A934KI99_9FLAO|nr:hypothetical protein [Gelidibacter salicanalis]MBJ7879487.1 hypothetical protein [Gelidibacter salicanalis]